MGFLDGWPVGYGDGIIVGGADGMEDKVGPLLRL